MPKSKRSAPPNCYWRGDVLWGRIEVRGTEVRWSLRTSDPREAARRVKERRTREVSYAHFGERRFTYTEVATAWAGWIANQVAATTAKRYAVSLKTLEPLLLHLHLDEIDTRKLSEIVKARREDGVTNATIRRDLGAVSSVLGYAEAEGWRDDNPALVWLRRVRERRDPIMLPEPADIRKLIARASPGLASLIEGAWLTGCRLSELVNARRSQLDRARKQLTVVGKGNKLRVIDLAGWGFEVFERLPAGLSHAWLFHERGAPMAEVSSRFYRLARTEQRRARKAAGAGNEPDFTPFRFHDLRHRHAVDWLKSGRSIYDLQHRLGHTSIKTTEIYLSYLTAEEVRIAKFGVGTHGGTAG